MVNWDDAPEGAEYYGRAADHQFVAPKTTVESSLRIHEDADTHNKYDRVIHGKYGGGSATVDVYRVLNAFGPLPPETQHAIKKLLAPGQRGVKDERQDLLEAIQSIEARLRYLEDVENV